MNEKVTQQYFDAIVESISDPLLLISKDYQIVFMNSAAKKLYGDVISESQEHFCYKVTHNIDTHCREKGEQCPVYDVFKTKQPAKVVHQHVGKNGKVEVHEVSAAPLFDEHGEVAEVVEIVRDMSESAVVKTLETSEKKYRNLILTSPRAIITFNAVGEITDFNPGAQKIFAYPEEKIIGKSFLTLIPKSLRAQYAEDLKTAVESGEYKYIGKTTETLGLTSSGDEFPINATLSNWESEGEQFFCAIVEDLTERVNLEKALKNEKDQLEHAQKELLKKHEEMNKIFKHVERAKREWEQSMDCISDIVIITNENNEIIRANKPVLTIINKPFLEIIGRKWNELFLEHDIKKSGEFEGNPEFFHQSLNKYFSVRVHTVSSDLSQSSHAITLHDVTERKLITAELEERNTQIEEAYDELKATQSQILQQEKMASIGQLAAGVAHEINNPVGFITSNIGSLAKYVDKLQEYIEAQSAVIENYENFLETDELTALREKLKIEFILEDVKDLIQESLDGTDRVKKIVQNLKNFSRVDQTDHSMADINECVESTLNIVWNELKYKTTVNKNYGQIPRTYCYPQQLNQVFMNLLVNGAQAIEEKGEIHITTWSENGFIYVSIADTGCGIKEENLSKLFEPFFTTKDVGKGTGLGLSIAYDIVTKKHEGELLVESEVGKGTTFTVKIPVVERGNDE